MKASSTGHRTAQHKPSAHVPDQCLPKAERAAASTQASGSKCRNAQSHILQPDSKPQRKRERTPVEAATTQMLRTPAAAKTQQPVVLQTQLQPNPAQHKGLGPAMSERSACPVSTNYSPKAVQGCCHHHTTACTTCTACQAQHVGASLSHGATSMRSQGG